MSSPEVIAVLTPSPFRRVAGVASLVALGLACIWIAVAGQPEQPLWTVALLGLGAGALWLAEALRRATRARLELTEAELRSSDGRVLAPLARIRGVERGVFVFKPSSGFLVSLDAPAPRAWAPGLWWRIGRRIGVGGVTPGHQARAMADALAVLLSRRS